MPATVLFVVGLLVGGCAPEEPRSASSSGPPEGAESDALPASPVVLFFGTSLTAGYGLADPTDAFPARIGEKLDSAGFGHGVVNAGVPGETSAAGLRRIGWVLRNRDPDVVVLELGANDGLRGQEPGVMRENLDAVIDSIQVHSPGASILLAGMEAPPNLGARYTDEFRSVFREVAEEHDAALIPFLLDGVAGEAELNQGDRIHPNAAGHARVAANVWPVLDSLLRSRSVPAGAGEGGLTPR